MARKVKEAAGELVFIDDVVDEFDVSIQTVRTWVKDKCPVKKIDGRLRFDIAAVAAWRRDRGMNTHNRNAASSPDIDAARLRKENALADKYEIHVARERGQLVEVAEVKRLWTNVARVTRSTMQGVGAAVALQWPGPDAGKLQAVIDSEVEGRLKQLSMFSGYGDCQPTDH